MLLTDIARAKEIFLGRLSSLENMRSMSPSCPLDSAPIYDSQPEDEVGIVKSRWGLAYFCPTLMHADVSAMYLTLMIHEVKHLSLSLSRSCRTTKASLLRMAAFLYQQRHQISYIHYWERLV